MPAKDVVADILAGYLETVGTGCQRVLCFFFLPLSSEVLPGKQQKLLAIFGGGQIRVPLLQINSLTRNREQMGVQASEIWLMLVRFPGTILRC